MEFITAGLLALIAGETSYLTYKATPKNKIEKQSLLIDTSVLIDGRILSIARSGLITAPLIILRSVIREMQYMADKSDHDKRERAREGLDMIEQLKRIETVTIRIIDDKGNESGVDERLTELAREYGARLCTIDYNLNKAASAQGVVVVNINELAHALRVIHLPGETIRLKLVQVGQENRQAVGYLDDGTMVVVDDAKAMIGHEVETEVTRVLQTTAGKMMFAKLVSAKKPQNDSKISAIAMKSNNPKIRGTANNSVSPSTDEKQITHQAKVAAPELSHDHSERSKASASAQSRGTVSGRKPQQQVDQGTQKPRPNQYRHNNRRRSPEDSLVDLANE